MMNLAEPNHTNYDLRFEVFGFPVRIHPLFWLMAFILGALSSAGLPEANTLVLIVIWVLVVFVSILVHELGHAVAMRYHGEAARVVLYMMGGLAIRDDSPWSFSMPRPREPKEQIFISAAGPLAGFAFAIVIVGIVFAAGGAVDFSLSNVVLPSWSVELKQGEFPGDTIAANPRMIYLWMMIQAALFVNIYWGLINLVPVYPLDGGQIARAAFMQFDPWQGVTRSLWLSIISGAVVAVLGFASGQRFLGIMFGLLAFSSWQALQQTGGGPGGFGGPRRW